MASLNVIALVSGGKDSLFSLMHCLLNGHAVVALANLHPSIKEQVQGLHEAPPIRSEELDSFMYQTAGHNLIPLLAKSLNLPLYRQAITGTAVNSSKYYAHTAVSDGHPNRTEWDETEDLIPLLQKIKESHPEANAVCSGAILSTYQRTRVESVATRLGLVSLAYLWQYPMLPCPSQAGLLEDMAKVGLDVRIVKVASGGLDQSILWSNLMDIGVRMKIQRAMSRFGGSVLGEGGEYETIVVDGPPPLWLHRLDVDTKYMRATTDEGGAAFLTFDSDAGNLVQKSIDSTKSHWLKGLRKLSLWDSEFDVLRHRVPVENLPKLNGFQANKTQDQEIWTIGSCESRQGPFYHVANLTSEGVGNVEAQMADIKTTILHKLNQLGRSTGDIVFSTIILHSIKRDFIAVNEIYAQLFPLANPPARVTIASQLPFGVDVIVSIVIDMRECSQWDALHVQSRSYWAPANVGPYSQAIKTPVGHASMVYMAGQIPLVPATMEPLHPYILRSDETMQLNGLKTFHENACLSLQHLWRVGRALDVGWWIGGVAFIVGNNEVEAKARIALRGWTQAHDPGLWLQETSDDDKTIDLWDRTHGAERSLAAQPTDDVGLPDFDRLASKGGPSEPAFLAVEVEELPRGVDIEWHSLGSSNNDVRIETIQLDRLKGSRYSMIQSQWRTTVINIPEQDEMAPHYVADAILTASDAAPGCNSTSIVYTDRPSLILGAAAQIIPCKSVWGRWGSNFDRLAAGIVIHSSPPLEGD